MSSSSNTKTGKVALVGAGPGDPLLLTLRGKALLAAADVVVYDYLSNPQLLDFAKETAERIYVGKKGGSLNSEHQEKINQRLVASAKAGKAVVRLKGGDPFIFGRGGEEVEALLAASIPFEVVPGITSAIGVPTYAGIPLTHRKMASSLTIITGHEDPGKTQSPFNWEKLATGTDTLVFLMAMGNLKSITQTLLKQGKRPDTPAALIQWGSYPYQKTVTGTLASLVAVAGKAEIKPPVVMVVGEVVALRDQINWFEKRPLFGKRILVTRAKAQAGEFIDQLRAFGAETVAFPTLQIVPPPNWDALDAAINHIERYDVLIFTSVNGVSFFKRRLRALRKDLRQLKGLFICAIGPRTAEAIEDWDLRVDLIPSEFKAEGLLTLLSARGVKGKRFLIPRALEAREILPDTLRDLGGDVDVVPAYQALRPVYAARDIKKLLSPRKIDMITFASASTLRHFADIVGKECFEQEFKDSKLACIGPVTAEAAKALNLEISVVPKDYTFPALTAAIVDYYQNLA